MRQYLTIEDFLAAARESMSRMAVYYRPDASSQVGSIRVASQGTTGSIAFKWQTVDGVDTLDALVNFPSLPVNAKLTRREAEIWLGYACHEIGGHAFHTDTRAWDNAVAEGRSFARLVNGLEDPRVEALAVEKIPGARRRLEDLLGHILDKALANGFTPMDPRNLPFAFAVLGRARLGILSDRIRRDIASKLTPAARAWFARHLDTLAAAKSTADVVALARIIRDEVTLPPDTQGSDLPDSDQPEPEKTGGDTRGSTTDIDGGEDVNGAPDQDNQTVSGDQDQEPAAEPQEGGQAAGSDQEPGDASNAPQDAPDEAGDGTGEGGAGDRAPWSLPKDMGDMQDPEPEIGDMVEKINARAEKAGDAGHAFGGVQIYRAAPRGFNPSTAVHPGCADELKAAARLGSAKNRGLLRQILVANERCGWNAYERSGSLNPGDIARSQTGDGNVFRKRWLEEGISTTVSVLVDGSSSMGGEPMCYATAMAYVLADVTEKCGLQSEVAVFRDGSVGSASLPVFDNGWRPIENPDDRYKAMRRMTTRLDARRSGSGTPTENGTSGGDSCSLYLIQERGERLSAPAVMDRFSRMFTSPGGGTPDFAGTMGMIERLARTAGDRKILFVVTDGAGNMDAMTWVASWAKRKHDIDIVGVGIGGHTAGYLEKQYRLWTVAKLGRRCGGGGRGAGAAWAKFASEALTLLVKQARQNFTARRAG